MSLYRFLTLYISYVKNAQIIYRIHPNLLFLFINKSILLTSSPPPFFFISGPQENIWSNFEQYGLSNQYVGVMVADSARPPWTQHATFDAIVADRMSVVTMKCSALYVEN